MSEACFHNLFLAIRQKRIEELFEDKPFFGSCALPLAGWPPWPRGQIRGLQVTGSRGGSISPELCSFRQIS